MVFISSFSLSRLSRHVNPSILLLRIILFFCFFYCLFLLRYLLFYTDIFPGPCHIPYLSLLPFPSHSASSLLSSDAF